MTRLFANAELVKKVMGDVSPFLSGALAWIMSGGLFGLVFGLLALVLLMVRIAGAMMEVYSKFLDNKKKSIELQTLQQINAEMATDLEEKLMILIQKAQSTKDATNEKV